MSEAADHASVWSLWRRNLIVWAALLCLLGLTLGLAYLPLGSFNVIAGLGIAAVKVSLVALLFMELRRSNTLIRLAAVAGLLWIVVLFALTLSDILTRVQAS